MTTKLGAFALVLLLAAPAMAGRAYKPLPVNMNSYKAVSLKTYPCCDRPGYIALIPKQGGSGNFLIERGGGFGGMAGFSKVMVANRSFKPLNLKLGDYKATPLQTGFVNPDFPRLTLLTAKDGSGKAFIQRSGGFTANPQPQFAPLRY